MRLFNTAAREVQPLDLSSRLISMYVCGITPYDSSHLGHAFTYHVFDVITRRLSYAGKTVRSVRNITDVDDDMMRIAKQRQLDYQEIATQQITNFDAAMDLIHILPVIAPRATTYVVDMVEWVGRLQSASYAYEVDGWLYFDVSKFPAYGKLSHLDQTTMIELSKERGADPKDPKKRHPLDFVLWQPSATDEPWWPSQWGDGRPGWHIECSVLATKYLQLPLSIHGGGEDLIYPHHESEIAQIEAIEPPPFVKTWVHVAMVQCHGEKMSKSLGNMVFVHDLLESATGGEIRLMLSAQHYRQSWNYEHELFEAAKDRAQLYHRAIIAKTELPSNDKTKVEQQFFQYLDDDLDTPGALLVLDKLAKSSRSDGKLLQKLLAVLGCFLE